MPFRAAKIGAREEEQSERTDGSLTRERMLRAMRENDRRFDGRFFVCVHTTGIYCLPSCTARLPHASNVSFQPTREAAVMAGFRACKRCRPNRYPDTLPDWVMTVIHYLQKRTDRKVSEQELASLAGVDITTIRRHFKTSTGLTPLAFHRRHRLMYAASLLAEGQDCLSAALACGFDSVSGFRDAYSRQFGLSPGQSKGEQPCHTRSA